MTPSEAHDSARNRDAGHDEMQAEVWRYYNDNPFPKGIRLAEALSYDTGGMFRASRAHVEYPLVVKGSRSYGSRISAFADVLLQVGTVEYDELPKSKEHRSERYGSPPFKTAWACLIFEVKPTIHSVGAVIRQCKAIRHIVGLTDLKCASVIPVVNSSDPKFSLLREMMPEVIGWADGGPT